MQQSREQSIASATQSDSEQSEIMAPVLPTTPGKFVHSKKFGIKNDV